MSYLRFSTRYHCKNVEITPELLDDLNKMTFNDVRDTFITNSWSMLPFIPDLLCSLKELV